MKFKFVFSWSVFWVGAFWEIENKRLFIFPLPMFGLVITFARLSKKDQSALDQVKMVLTPRQLREKKIRRNDPCPCGSRRKYKKCCMVGVEKETESLEGR